MPFDNRFLNYLVARAYNEVGDPDNHLWPLAGVLHVFEYYFASYENFMGQVHPNIRLEQIKRIVAAMPCIEEEHSRTVDLDPNDYDALIDQHFHTHYRGKCDFNINHFFSRFVRRILYYKAVM